MESISARDLDRRLADLVRSERHLVVRFLVELAGFAKRELYRELGYTSLFYYCVRQLGLSKYRYVPAAVKRAVWERDQGRCTWPMGDGELCGSTHRLEFDHDLEVALGGKTTIENVRLLCKSHNLMKAEQHLGRTLMAKFRKDRPAGRDTC
jgi:hypothetical protein